MADRVLVVVPTYNERENVRQLLMELLAQGESVDVWVADDGSPDGTADAVREVMAEHRGRVDLLLRKEKAGRGAAVIAAFRKRLADPPLGRAEDPGLRHCARERRPTDRLSSSCCCRPSAHPRTWPGLLLPQT